MIRSRTIAISLAALTVTACAHKTLQEGATTRFDSAPLATYKTPATTSTLSQKTVKEAAKLASADRHIDEDLLEDVSDDKSPATSARSNISLL